MRPLPGGLLVLIVLLSAGCAPVVVPAGPPHVKAFVHEDMLRTFDGSELPLHSWLPAEGATGVQAVVLALHGFNDYGNFFASPAAYLAERGIASYAYDQRGFGMAPHRGFWPGVNALKADVHAAVTALHKRHPDVPLYLLGESMGAAVAIVVMTSPDPPEVDGVILSAPAVWGREMMPWYQTAALWVSAHTVPWAKLSGRKLGIVASDNIEMLRALSRDPLVIKKTRLDAVYGLVDLMDQALVAAENFDHDALILYGERDELVPREPVQRFLADLPVTRAGLHRVAIYESGYHMLLRDLQAETVWGDIASWIADGSAPLPSGSDARVMASGTCRVWNLCDKVPAVPAHGTPG